jgi:hypothetical protein
MSSFRKEYGNTEGPLGFPMTDRQARAVELLLKSLPKSKEYEYRKAVCLKAPTELNPGERSDVSWITTESVDRVNDVVMSRGMNDAQFQANPLVTLGHAYGLPPIGRSLWRKRVKDGDLVGIKAKTRYPEKPDSWPADEPWPSDKVFALVGAGLLNGKSIGFLPTKVHYADDKEAVKNGWPVGAHVIDEWLLLEYACVFLPANQEALVEAVSKGTVEVPADLLAALGLTVGHVSNVPDNTGTFPTCPTAIRNPQWFLPLAEIENAVRRQLAGLDINRLVVEAIERRRGRV